jgi:hypothetical protein
VTDLGWRDAIVCAVIGFTACLAIIPVITRPRRNRRSLARYRPSHDNRFPHRDEFKVFMRDVK